MCGFGTKDYRPVDPAPILQLVRRESGQVIPKYIECPSLVCHASLWSEDGTEERGVVLNPSVTGSRRHDAQAYSDNLPPNPANYIQVLVGLLVSPCHILADVDGQRGMFFTFPDLSVRTSGQYRIKFCLYDIMRDASHAKACVLSEIMTVYPPKSFPGMTESTQLAKCIARQGIKLHIRSDVRRNSQTQSDLEEFAGGGGGGGSGAGSGSSSTLEGFGLGAPSRVKGGNGSGTGSVGSGGSGSGSGSIPGGLADLGVGFRGSQSAPHLPLSGGTPGFRHQPQQQQQAWTVSDPSAFTPFSGSGSGSSGGGVPGSGLGSGSGGSGEFSPVGLGVGGAGVDKGSVLGTGKVVQTPDQEVPLTGDGRKKKGR
ncbi:hypothetical protein HDV00_009565 [Rhizophlyctis rosea]|nr:hypothetical protein HDV00_009565 [Rhizophlyctis rosea]